MLKPAQLLFGYRLLMAIQFWHKAGLHPQPPRWWFRAIITTLVLAGDVGPATFLFHFRVPTLFSIEAYVLETYQERLTYHTMLVWAAHCGLLEDRRRTLLRACQQAARYFHITSSDSWLRATVFAPCPDVCFVQLPQRELSV